MTAAARFSAPSGETAPPVSSPSSRRLPSETTSRERRAVSCDAWPSSAILTNTTLRASGRAPKTRTSATSRARNVAKKRRGKRSGIRRPGEPTKRIGTRMTSAASPAATAAPVTARGESAGAANPVKPDATARTCTRRSPSGVGTVSTASPDRRARFRIRPGISTPSPRDPVARPAASHSSRSTATRSGTSREATAESSGSRSSSRGQATCWNSAANPAGITAGETRSAPRRPGRMTPNDDTVAPSGLRIVRVSPSSGKLSSAPRAQSARARSSRCVRSPAGSHGSRDAEATRRSQRLTDSARTAAPSARASPSAAAIAASACLRRPSASPAATRSVAAARMNTAVAARDRRSVSGEGRTRRASANASATDASARHGKWPVDPALASAATRAPSPTAAAAPALRRVAPGLGRRDAHARAAAASASRPVCARKSGRPRRHEAHRVEETRGDESGGAPEEAGRERERNREEDARRVRRATCARSPHERPRETQRREAREEYVRRRPEEPEEKRRIPSEREQTRGADRRSKQEGEPGGHDAGRGAPGREPQGHRENREKDGWPESARAPHLLFRDLRFGRLHGEREQPVAPLGPRHAHPEARRAVPEREELDEIRPQDPRRIAPGNDERAARPPLVAGRHPGEEHARDVKGSDEPRSGRAPFGLESRGLARPRDGAARAVEEDRAPARAFRKRLPQDREEPRRTHFRAAPVRDRREFPAGVNPFRRSAERLTVAFEGLLRSAEEERGTGVPGGGARRHEARGERQSERDQRRDEETENNPAARAQRRRGQGRQRAIGILIPWRAALASASS